MLIGKMTSTIQLYKTRIAEANKILDLVKFLRQNERKDRVSIQKFDQTSPRLLKSDLESVLQ